MNNFRFFCSFQIFFKNSSDFVNFDDYIGKIISKCIRLKPVFIQKRFEVIKIQIFFNEKMKNSGNYIYDYTHSFFGEDFQSNAL